MDIDSIVLNSIMKNLMIESIPNIEVPLMSLENADSMSQLLIIRDIEESIGKSFTFEELMEIELISDLIKLSKLKINDS